MSKKLDVIRGEIDLAMGAIEMQVGVLTKSMFACEPNRWGCCIPWAIAGGFMLHKVFGHEAMPVGGSVYMLANNDPDPMPTHFSVVYTEGSRGLMIGGIETLPEIHSWIYLPKAGVMVDFSARFAKEFAVGCGLKWDQPSPDGVLVFDIETGEGLLKGWRYEAVQSASVLIRDKAKGLMKDHLDMLKGVEREAL